jgi:hypothetical protein
MPDLLDYTKRKASKEGGIVKCPVCGRNGKQTVSRLIHKELIILKDDEAFSMIISDQCLVAPKCRA